MAAGESAPAAEAPPVREFIIQRGFAWASASYDRVDDSGNLIGGAADQTAALWDHFARTFGRPSRTIAFGESMGGAAALLSVERYADRYDGAIAACGSAGETPDAQILTDTVSAGAFAANLPAEVFQRTELWPSVFELIVPKLNSDRSQTLSSHLDRPDRGPRPFAVEGFNDRERGTWALAVEFARRRVLDNDETIFVLSDDVGVSSDEFNRRAPRIAQVSGPRIDPSDDITGNIRRPLLVMHTTGDGILPLRHVDEIERKVREAGRSEQLAIRIVKDPRHCGFADDEYKSALEELTAWLDRGQRFPAPGGNVGRIWDPQADPVTYETLGLD